VANPVQAFGDSDLGVVTAITLHTLGAIGFLGGLVAYLAWHRLLHRGHPHASLLRGAAFTTYVSIGANLLGGFLRTYESDHPHLGDFARSPWVQAIAVKHLFLFAGMGAALYLFERVAPRHLRAHRDGTLDSLSPRGHRVAASLVALAIVMGAVLGSVSQVVAEFPAAPEPPGPPLVTRNVTENFTGSLSSSPLQPAFSTGTFQVPEGARSLRVRLDWTPAPSTLRVSLAGPGGQTVAAGPSTGGHAESESPPGQALQPGQWSYTIDSTDPVAQAQWNLQVGLVFTSALAAAHP
jgi:hypothetical protein